MEKVISGIGWPSRPSPSWPWRHWVTLGMAVLVALASLVLMPTAAHAALTFGSPAFSIETDTRFDAESDSAAAPDGTTLFAYVAREGDDQPFEIRLARVAAPDGSTTQQTVAQSPGWFSEPEIVVDSAGVATIAWRQKDAVSFVRVTSNGTVTSEGQLDDNPGSVGRVDVVVPLLDVAPNGVVTATWVASDAKDEMRAARVTPQGAVVDKTRVGMKGRLVGSPALAVDREGDAAVVLSWFGRNGYRCQIKGLQSNGSQVRGPKFDCSFDKRMVVADDGTLTLAVTKVSRQGDNAQIFQFRNDTLKQRSHELIKSARSLPDLEIKPSTDRPTLVWSGGLPPGKSGILMAQLRKKGSLGRVRTLAEGPRGPRIAYDSRSRALIMWRQLDGVLLAKDGSVKSVVEGGSDSDSERLIRTILFAPGGRPTVVYMRALDNTFTVNIAQGEFVHATE